MNRKVGRVARGYKEHQCRQCFTGWVPGTVKTFDPKCEGCQAKLSKGLRTGEEQMPHFRLDEKLSFSGFKAQKRADMAEGRARSRYSFISAPVAR